MYAYRRELPGPVWVGCVLLLGLVPVAGGQEPVTAPGAASDVPDVLPANPTISEVRPLPATKTTTIDDLERQLAETRARLEEMQAQFERMNRNAHRDSQDVESATATPSAGELLGHLEQDIREAIEEASQARQEALKELERAKSETLKEAIKDQAKAADKLEKSAKACEAKRKAEGAGAQRDEIQAATRESQRKIREAQRVLREAERKARQARRSGSWVDILGEGELGDGERLALGSDAIVKAGETVPELIVLAGNGDVFGTVEGDAVVTAGSLVVHRGGKVKGDAVVMAGEIVVEDGGHIEGEMVTLSPGTLLQKFHQGGRHKEQWDYLPDPSESSFWSRVRHGLVLYLVLIAAGLLSLTFIPKRVHRIGTVLEARAWTSGLVGVLTMIALLPITIFLIATVIGILVVPFVYGGLLLASLTGLTALAQVLARRIPLRRGPKTPGGVLLWGTAIFTIAALLPFIGYLLGITGALFGLGAVILSRFGDLDDTI